MQLIDTLKTYDIDCFDYVTNRKTMFSNMNFYQGVHCIYLGYESKVRRAQLICKLQSLIVLEAF